MPRISIKKDEYVMTDITKKIKGRCAELGINQEQLADVLLISQPAMSKKMATGSYTLRDFLKIAKYLKFTTEEIIKMIG